MPEARLSIDLNPIRGGLTSFALGFRPFFLGAGAAAVLLICFTPAAPSFSTG